MVAGIGNSADHRCPDSYRNSLVRHTIADLLSKRNRIRIMLKVIEENCTVCRFEDLEWAALQEREQQQS